MAKVNKTAQADDDLNASEDTTTVAEEISATDDLNASEDTGTDSEVSGDDTESATDSEPPNAPEYVVLKGNHVRHDGEVYRENSVIPVTGVDAQRLLNAGVIGDAAVLRQRALSTNPAVSVTSE